MNKIEFPDGVKPLDIFMSSIQKEREADTVEGMNGKIDYGAVYKEREIRLEMRLKAYDTHDYRLLRNKVYAMLDEVAYVSEEYEPGKRYNVTVDDQYIPDRIVGNQRLATAEISCNMPGLPFAESIGTTLDIEERGVLYSQELWGYGMGLLYGDDAQKYEHRSLEFAIFNAGNVPIHPFDQSLKISIDNVGKNYELQNTTTGDIFKYTGKTTGKFILDGPNMTIKGLQTFRDTNHQYITLAPGWNFFKQNKAKRIKFGFPFYYK